MPGTRVTLRDVAEHAGVSRSSASLALRGDGRLADETRSRVLQAMDDLGYVYNRSAAAMREKTRRLIGVVVTNIENAFFAQSVQAIEAELDRRGYSAILASSLKSATRQDQVLQYMREFGVAGVVLAAVEDTGREAAQTLERAGIPCLSYTRLFEGDSLDYVGPNDREGGRVAARHLLWHGARTFAFIGSHTPSSASELRLAGVREELATQALDGSLHVFNESMTAEGGYRAGQALLAAGGLPDAVVAASDHVAFGLYRALHDVGAAAQTRVIGFDDVEVAAYSIPRLTTVSARPAVLGALAATSLVERLEGVRPPHHVDFIAPDLVIRESCGCA